MGKSDANECNENSFSNCRVQLALSTKRDGVIFEKFQVSLSSCLGYGNKKRFPDYYMFRLTEEEWNNWKSQFVTSNYMSEVEIQAIKMGVRSLKD